MDETDSKLEEQLKDIQEKLNLYTKSKNMSKNTKLSYDSVNKYLDMDAKELRSMSEEDCDEGAFILGQASLEIQREINENTAIVKWLDAQITKTIAPLITNYKTYSYEGNKNAAIYDNTYAKRAHEFKVRFDIRIASLSYMSQEIKNLQSILLNVKSTKRRFNQNA